MVNQKVFTNVSKAVSFENNCFQYECAYVELCMEGNVFENSCHHVIRYFSDIVGAKSFTSQWLKQVALSNKQVEELKPLYSAALLNTAC